MVMQSAIPPLFVLRIIVTMQHYFFSRSSYSMCCVLCRTDEEYYEELCSAVLRCDVCCAVLCCARSRTQRTEDLKNDLPFFQRSISQLTKSKKRTVSFFPIRTKTLFLFFFSFFVFFKECCVFLG
jgi:hypothetical protein